MADYEIPNYVREAGQQAAEMAGVAGNYNAAAPSIGDILRDKISKAYSENKDIIEKLDSATSEYFSAPSEFRNKYLNPESPDYLHNPFAAENLMSKYVSNKALPMLSYGNMLGARMGGISDIVKSGVSGFQSLAEQKKAEAANALRDYENKLGEFDLLSRLKQQADEFTQRKYEFETETGLEKERLALQKASAGKTTESEKESQYTKELANDARNGITLTDAQNKYSGKLDVSTIVEVYTANSIYGTPQEDWAKQVLGIYSKDVYDPGDI